MGRTVGSLDIIIVLVVVMMSVQLERLRVPVHS